MIIVFIVLLFQLTYYARLALIYKGEYPKFLTFQIYEMDKFIQKFIQRKFIFK